MVTRSLLSSYMRLVRRRPAGDWCSVVAGAACVAPWGGRGRYKSLLPHTQSFTLEEENQHGGLVNLERRDPPNPPTIYQQQASISQHCTVLAHGPALKRTFTLPRRNKCQEKQRKSQQIRIAARKKWREIRRVGPTRRQEKCTGRVHCLSQCILFVPEEP